VRRIATIAALVGGLLAGSMVPADAGLEDDLRRVGSRVRELEALVGGVRSERTDLANLIIDTGTRLESLSGDLRVAVELLAENDRQLAAAAARIAELSQRIAEREIVVAALRLDIDGVRSAAVGRAVELYMLGEANPALAVFRYEDMGRLSIGIIYAGLAQESADRTIADLEILSLQERREQERLAVERFTLSREAELLAVQRAERADTAALVESRRAEVTAELEVQSRQLAELEEEIAHIEGEIAALAREQAYIEELIRRESSGGGSRPGALVRPVPGGVSSGYGYRIHPIFGDRRLHTGWDMNAACGDPIRASAAGTVIYVGWRGGYGNTVIVDHGGGMSTLYAHQSSMGSAYGQSVAAGEVIGRIGTTGVSTGCHLHFEVRVNAVPVDPAPYM
jgi:murein DD-endopeptidase MepM/ murein hydrolase activator NlpD